MKINNLFQMLLCICLTVSSQFVKANDNKITYLTTKLAENTYVITRSWDGTEKSRNNIGVIVGSDGLTLINVMYEDELDQLYDVISNISDKPIQFVFNSNWDFHNTDANKALRAKGATLIAHENIKYFDNTVTQLTFSDELSLDIGTDTIVAYRSYGHSLGHINIHLKKANVMFMSDSYRDQWMTTSGPFGYQGHIKALNSALAQSNVDTKFIPGNTSSSVYVDREKVIKEIDIRKNYVSRVLKLNKLNMSVEEISQDQELHKLLSDNYERYPEYGKNIEGSVRSALYGDRLQNNKNKNLMEYTGKFQLPNGMPVDLFINEGHLFARSLNQFYYLLSPVSKDTFEFGWHFPDRKIVFIRNEDSTIKGFRVSLPKDDNRFGQELALAYLKDIKLIKRLE